MSLTDSGVDNFTASASERCDKLLADRYASFHSRNYCQQLISSGYVKVKGVPVAKKGMIVKAGVEVEVVFRSLPPPDLIPEALPLTFLYEDEEIVVIDKSAGMVVHPAPGHWSGTVVNALLYHCQEAPLWQRTEAGELRPGIVHRLDKETTGLLIAAKTTRAHRALTEAFAERRVFKRYLAICHGNPREKIIDAPIGRHPRERQRMAVVAGGKKACTHCKALVSNGGFSLVEARPQMGRTHQIRVHLHHIRCPILGDSLYSNVAPLRFAVERHQLHAWQLAFPHPLSQHFLSLTSPIPADMRNAICHLFPSSATLEQLRREELEWLKPFQL